METFVEYKPFGELTPEQQVPLFLAQIRGEGLETVNRFNKQWTRMTRTEPFEHSRIYRLAVPQTQEELDLEHKEMEGTRLREALTTISQKYTSLSKKQKKAIEAGDRVVGLPSATSEYSYTTEGTEWNVKEARDGLLFIEAGLSRPFCVREEHFELVEKGMPPTFGELGDIYKGELLLAHFNETPIQFKADKYSEWTDIDNPAFTPSAAYRIKPEQTEQERELSELKEMLDKMSAELKETNRDIYRLKDIVAEQRQFVESREEEPEVEDWWV
jgi:hypothetical protein